jgi:hypothetical protein
MEGLQIYIDKDKRPSNDGGTDSSHFGDAISETDAREFIWEKISRKIIRQTLKTFYSQDGTTQ